MAAHHLPGGHLLRASVAALAALGVSGLADAAVEHDGLSRVDPVAAADVLRIRASTLTDVALGLSFIGSEVVIGALAVIVFVLLLSRRTFARAATFAIGIGGSAFLTVAVSSSSRDRDLVVSTGSDPWTPPIRSRPATP